MNEQVPTVSVLMCVYNDEKFVGYAIESILGQTFQDFEFVIVNDGSTDRTVDILAEYSAKDTRIRVFSQANAGTTAAANMGLSVVRGKYVARLDSDDVSNPHRLQTEVDFLASHSEVALVGGGADIIDLTGAIVGERNIRTMSPARTLTHRCIYQQSDVMFRRDIVVALGGYREKFRNAQDYDLWLRISEVADVAKLNEILGSWRLNGGGYTLSRAREQKEEVRIIKRFAQQRRSLGRDEYSAYSAPSPAKHRNGIGECEYGLWVGTVMLQAVRLREARAKFRDYLKTRIELKVVLLYLSTFAPAFVIQSLFHVRNIYLNKLN
jgi:glycosyltransferase involved in cell wall biosynthesis